MNNTCFLIWTHNRAAQAECLVRSIKENFENLPDILMLYSYSDEEYEKAYKKIDEEHETYLMVSEKTLEKPVNFMVDLCNSYSHLCFFADDNYFFRHTSVKEEYFKNTIFSFRLGLNTTCQDIFNNKWQRPLSYYSKKNGILTWRWSEYPSLDNYGYPMAFDGHVFSTKELKPILKDAHSVRHPPSMESYLVGQRHRVTPFLSSFEKSCCVNIPVNNMSGNTQSNKSLDIVEANKKFLNGERLHFFVDENEVIGCHQIFDFEWR